MLLRFCMVSDLIGKKEIAKLSGVSTSKINYLIERGIFPKHETIQVIQKGFSRKLWIRSVVLYFIESFDLKVRNNIGIPLDYSDRDRLVFMHRCFNSPKPRYIEPGSIISKYQ